MPDLSFALTGGPVTGVFLGTTTWAGLASYPAATYNGYRVRVSDVGPSGSDWISNGTMWVPVQGIVTLARSAVQASLTGTASETSLASVTIPAGIMGTNGQIRVTTFWSAGANNANAKTGRVRFGGISGTIYAAPALATLLTIQHQARFCNVNSASSQKGLATAVVAGLGATTGAVTTGAIDTTVDQTIVFSGQLANTGDTISLESYVVELLR